MWSLVSFCFTSMRSNVNISTFVNISLVRRARLVVYMVYSCPPIAKTFDSPPRSYRLWCQFEGIDEIVWFLAPPRTHFLHKNMDKICRLCHSHISTIGCVAGWSIAPMLPFKAATDLEKFRISHILPVLSWFPVAKVRPSGCHAGANE